MTPRDQADIERVLGFWLGPEAHGKWFETDPDFDRRVAAALAGDQRRAAAGACDQWTATAEGCLVLVILLDQVPRNLFRGEPRAFASDTRAREVARAAIDRGLDREIEEQIRRMFLYLPFEHSEDLVDQEACCRLMAALDEDPSWADWAVKHREVIARFGRFPHRNEVLGRASTEDEAAFLAEPDSAF